MDRPSRRSIRLKNYDYSTPGAYFVTVCTREKRCILSRVVKPSGDAVEEQLAAPAVVLTKAGRIVDEQIRLLPERFPSLSVDRFVVMPNHIHLLLTISAHAGGASSAPTAENRRRPDITHVVQVLKSQSSRLSGDAPLWQRSFYDHVVRSEAEYREIAEYIAVNPARWAEDRFYVKGE